jgi:type IV pilus assembly protein PilW
MKTHRAIKLKSSQGFTLVEIMVAMTVGILILIALSAVMVNNSTSRRSGDRNATVQTNARYAIDVLRREIQHAGYAGSTGLMPNTLENLKVFTSLPNPPLIANACSAQAGQLEWPFEASDNTTNANLFACVPNTDYVAGTDMLIVRHASQQPVIVPVGASTTDERVPFTLYYYSKYYAGDTGYGVGQGLPTRLTVPGQTVVAAESVHIVQESVYYIRPWSFSSTENPRIPALVRRSLVAGATGPSMSTGNADLIASGVSNMQLSFGMSDDRVGPAPNFAYQRWNANSANFVEARNKINVANSLESVRISLLIQSLTPDPQYVNSDTYQVGDVLVPAFNDNIRRVVASSTVQVRR